MAEGLRRWCSEALERLGGGARLITHILWRPLYTLVVFLCVCPSCRAGGGAQPVPVEQRVHCAAGGAAPRDGAAAGHRGAGAQRKAPLEPGGTQVGAQVAAVLSGFGICSGRLSTTAQLQPRTPLPSCIRPAPPPHPPTHPLNTLQPDTQRAQDVPGDRCPALRALPPAV